MLKFNPTTPLKFYAMVTAYVPGQGITTTWQNVTGGGYNVYYCEWTGTFGDRAMSAQALGVNDSASIRMTYSPDVYAKLRTTRVVVIKNADASAIVANAPDKNNPNVYELWGGVDNIKEANQFLEFKVRRYEGL